MWAIMKMSDEGVIGSIMGISGLEILAFLAAERHKFQTRKADESPYINHPIGVASILEDEADIHDVLILKAALLHDTIEDTNTSYEELVTRVGKDVADVVMEVIDDKSLGKGERKRHRIAHIKEISRDAKLVKLADGLYNCRDLLQRPPSDWSQERVQGYIVWSKAVIAGVRGLNGTLDAAWTGFTVVVSL